MTIKHDEFCVFNVLFFKTVNAETGRLPCNNLGLGFGKGGNNLDNMSI